MRVLGYEPMPWQVQVAEVGGELDPVTGLPCYRQVVFTVPRQSGKTVALLGWELHRAVMWPVQQQRIVYTAQTGTDARLKLTQDQVVGSCGRCSGPQMGSASGNLVDLKYRITVATGDIDGVSRLLGKLFPRRSPSRHAL